MCVVTGACGFLGKRLVRLLLEEENVAEIRLMDKHVPPKVLDTLEGKICLLANYSSFLSLSLVFTLNIMRL